MVSRLLITASVCAMVLAGTCGRETPAPERPTSRSTESPTAIPTSEPTHTPAAIIGPNEAWVHYDAAIRIEPGIRLAFYVRGNALYGLGQFQLAIRDYDKALRLDPKFVLGYLIRGLALNELDQHMQAVENYDQAINLSPDFTHAFIGRALAHAALGNDSRSSTGYRPGR